MEMGRGPTVLICGCWSHEYRIRGFELFLSHTVLLGLLLWILNLDVAGRSGEGKGENGLRYLGQKVRLWTSFFWSWFAEVIVRQWANIRGGKFRLFFQMGQHTSLCHHIEKVSWIFREF